MLRAHKPRARHAPARRAACARLGRCWRRSTRPERTHSGTATSRYVRFSTSEFDSSHMSPWSRRRLGARVARHPPRAPNHGQPHAQPRQRAFRVQCAHFRAHAGAFKTPRLPCFSVRRPQRLPSTAYAPSRSRARGLRRWQHRSHTGSAWQARARPRARFRARAGLIWGDFFIYLQ